MTANEIKNSGNSGQTPTYGATIPVFFLRYGNLQRRIAAPAARLNLTVTFHAILYKLITKKILDFTGG
jgi:hypothetical protein